jgi:hypothetical protein
VSADGGNSVLGEKDGELSRPINCTVTDIPTSVITYYILPYLLLLELDTVNCVDKKFKAMIEQFLHYAPWLSCGELNNCFRSLKILTIGGLLSRCCKRLVELDLGRLELIRLPFSCKATTLYLYTDEILEGIERILSNNQAMFRSLLPCQYASTRIFRALYRYCPLAIPGLSEITIWKHPISTSSIVKQCKPYELHQLYRIYWFMLETYRSIVYLNKHVIICTLERGKSTVVNAWIKSRKRNFSGTEEFKQYGNDDGIWKMFSHNLHENRTNCAKYKMRSHLFQVLHETGYDSIYCQDINNQKDIEALIVLANEVQHDYLDITQSAKRPQIVATIGSHLSSIPIQRLEKAFGGRENVMFMTFPKGYFSIDDFGVWNHADWQYYLKQIDDYYR